MNQTPDSSLDIASAKRPEGAPRSAGLTAWRAGQVVRSILLRRRLQAELSRGLWRALGLLAVGVGVGALIFVVGLVGGYVVVRKGAPELVETGTVAGLYAVMGALVLSSVGHAAQAFFTARDLWMWDSAPTGAPARFADRFAETAAAALPPTLALGSLALAGLHLGAGGGLLQASRAVAAVFIVAPIPVAAGVFFAHLFGAFLPAGRLRRLSLLVVGAAVTASLVWVRRLGVERLLTEDGANQMLSQARAVGAIGPGALPPTQLARFVVHGDLAGLLAGLVVVVVVVAAAFGAHVVWYRRARKLAVDESPSGVREGSLTSLILDAVVRPAHPSVQPLLRKDLLAFVRDPAQWGQVVLLVGVGVLYLVNASALSEGLRQLGPFSEVVLLAVHTGIVCFIAGGLAARFAFPQVGLEGPAFWLVEGAPVAPRRFLHAKWAAAVPVVVIFPSLLGVVGAWMLAAPLAMGMLCSVVIAAVSLAVAGVGVGRGAIKPLFDASSLSELAMGPGAIATVMQATALSGLASVGVGAVVGLQHAVDRGYATPATGLVIQVVAVVFLAVVARLSVWQAMAAGERALLDRRQAGGGEVGTLSDGAGFESLA